MDSKQHKSSIHQLIYSYLPKDPQDISKEEKVEKKEFDSSKPEIEINFKKINHLIVSIFSPNSQVKYDQTTQKEDISDAPNYQKMSSDFENLSGNESLTNIVKILPQMKEALENLIKVNEFNSNQILHLLNIL